LIRCSPPIKVPLGPVWRLGSLSGAQWLSLVRGRKEAPVSRRFTVLLAFVIGLGGLAACEDDDAYVHTLSVGEPVVATTTTTTTPPRPDHCTDYKNMEAGTAHPENQHWFNYLDARGYARVHISCVYGWGTAEWECLDSLWGAESSWRHDIRSGIPQAMPESKMADPAQGGGPDYKTNPRTQVRWGARYIAARYGVPQRANFHGHTHYGTGCHAGY
jgi:hypothetical protein